MLLINFAMVIEDQDDARYVEALYLRLGKIAAILQHFIGIPPFRWVNYSICPRFCKDFCFQISV